VTPTDRPWRRASVDELDAGLRDARRRGDASAVRAVFEELRQRRSSAARKLLERAASHAPPWPAVEWTERVLAIAQQLRPSTQGGCCVYLVVLEEKEDFGIYVGQSAKAPEERYAQHKAGGKLSSRHVLKRGLGLLSVPHLAIGMSRPESLEIEAELIGRLRRAGFVVRGA